MINSVNTSLISLRAKSNIPTPPKSQGLKIQKLKSPTSSAWVSALLSVSVHGLAIMALGVLIQTLPVVSKPTEVQSDFEASLSVENDLDGSNLADVLRGDGSVLAERAKDGSPPMTDLMLENTGNIVANLFQSTVEYSTSLHAVALEDDSNVDVQIFKLRQNTMPEEPCIAARFEANSETDTVHWNTASRNKNAVVAKGTSLPSLNSTTGMNTGVNGVKNGQGHAVGGTGVNGSGLGADPGLGTNVGSAKGGSSLGTATGTAEVAYCGPIKISGGRDTYPCNARRKKQEGTVLLSVEVLASGEVGEVKLLQSSGCLELDETALADAKNWRFKPAVLKGMVINDWVKIPVRYNLK